MTLREWFGLRRDNYFIDPRGNLEDREFYASRPHTLNIQQQITSLEVDLEAAMAPKKLYWGVYGGGKTHTLYKALHELGKRLPIHVAFVECPVLKKNSTFVELYSKTFEELGMNFVVALLDEAVRDAVTQTGYSEAENRLIEIIGDEDLARAAHRKALLNLDPIVLWRWITASGISAGERNDLRVRDVLSEADPTRLAVILIIVGRLLRGLRKQSLVLVYDEVDRTFGLNPDAAMTFAAAFTRLTEPSQTDAAVFFSTSASRIDEMPGFITEAVRGRIGRENIVEIPGMDPEDVNPFVRGVVEYVREPDIDIKERLESYKKETEENVGEDLYPFTEEAVDAIKTACGQIISPRDVCRLMGRGAAYAKLRGKHVVTNKDIESASTGGAY